MESSCSDIDLKMIPAKIEIPAQMDGKRNTKTGGKRYTFISYEATAAVREWIKVRGAYLEAASKMGKNFKTRNISVSVDDQRLFPVSIYSVTDDLKKAVEAGIDGGNKVCQETGRSLIHNHGFRKFFEGRFQNTQNNGLGIAKLLDGHADVISKTYAGMPVEEIAKLYLKGEHALLVLTSADYVEHQAELSKETTEIQEKLKITDARNAKLKDDIDDIRTSKDKLRDRMDDKDAEVNDLKAQIAAQNEMIAKIANKLEQYYNFAQEKKSEHSEVLFQNAEKEAEESQKIIPTHLCHSLFPTIAVFPTSNHTHIIRILSRN